MMRLFPEQLMTQLQGGLRMSYLLFGNEPLLLQESQDAIRHVAKAHGFTEHFSFTLDGHVEWDDIFCLCQAFSLFANRRSLLLILPDNGPGASISEQLLKLVPLLHEDMLLIVRGAKLTKAQENSIWFKTLSQHAIYVNCQTPEQTQLRHWVTQRAKHLDLSLDDQSNQLLCYCYEGNLLALSQVLERLALLWPGTQLSLVRVEQVVNDEARFAPWHWLDALLAGKSQRAWHIVQQLRLAGNDPLILLRSIQSDLMLLLTLKRRRANVPLSTLFNRHKVWQHRRNLMAQAVQRLSMQQLQQAMQLLTQIEIRFKEDYGQSIWPELETLSMLICGKQLPEFCLMQENSESQW